MIKLIIVVGHIKCVWKWVWRKWVIRNVGQTWPRCSTLESKKMNSPISNCQQIHSGLVL